MKYEKSCVIPDTSALIKNQNLLSLLLEDFKLVIIPQVVLNELNYQKDLKKNNDAWFAMQRINALVKEKKLVLDHSDNVSGINNDQKICNFARNYSSSHKNITVYIIHDDIGFSLNYENSLLLKDYLGESKTKKNKTDYDAYENNGNTPLINCIRSKSPDKYKKLIFLLEKCHVNPDKTDNSKYYLTPLSHCIQVNDFKAFCILLDHGADYNKGSINETKLEYIRRRNEGNTPLMIACWHGRKNFVEKLCSFSDIGLNQQDSNGFTPLIKCAWKKNTELYNYLLSFKRTDIYIRDRNNHTAQWWLSHSEKENNRE